MTTIPRVEFPSLVGVKNYEQGRALRLAADVKLIHAAKTPAELATVWASLEARGWWSKEERAHSADSLLGAMVLFAHGAE